MKNTIAKEDILRARLCQAEEARALAELRAAQLQRQVAYLELGRKYALADGDDVNLETGAITRAKKEAEDAPV